MLYNYNESMAEECANIFYDIYTSDEFKFDFLTRENVLDYINEVAENLEFKGYVYIQNKKIVGFCLGRNQLTFGNKMFEIAEICVKNEVRGKGIGKILMSEMEKDLKNKDYVCINLNTKRTIKAYDFYLKYGFVEKQDVVQLMKSI